MQLDKVEQLTKDLLKKHGVAGWDIKFFGKVNTLGLCSYQDKTIYLSKKQMRDLPDSDVINTILHEIAHVLTPGEQHSHKWAAKAKELGALPYSCHIPIDFIPDVVPTLDNPYHCKNCKVDREIVSDKVYDKIRMLKLSCGHTYAEKVAEAWTMKSVDGYEPYPYQYKGIDFIKQAGFNALIADEQGLGKTIQGIGALKRYPEELLPCLILCKSALKMQWYVQMLKWAGIDYLPQVIEDSKLPPVPGFNVYIASYDILRRFSKNVTKQTKSLWGHEYEEEVKDSPFYSFPFKAVILDEVQSIKGKSSRSAEVKAICKGKRVIALSGTPIKNSAAEYYTILHMLSPDNFPSESDYMNRWVDYDVIKGMRKNKGIRFPERFKEITKSFIIRREREEVKQEIGMRVTSANRLFHNVDFESEKLKRLYEKAEADFIKEMESKARKDTTSIIAAISVMRHLVGLNKILPTVDLAQEFLENKEGKLLIFVHHHDVRDSIRQLLAKYCLENDLAEPLTYFGAADSDVVKQFQEGKNRILIASTSAAGEGVDGLQHVCHECIFTERQWNPANEEQAESRLVRIGQEHDFVDANYMVAVGTIDEYFTDIIEKKRNYVKSTHGVAEWDEGSLMQALYEAVLSKGRSRLVRGF